MKWKILRGEVAAMTDTASSTHSRTVQLNRQVLELRHKADALKSRAIDLRRQAKSALLSSDAFAMRHEAKQKMSEASDLKATAKKLEKELRGALKESAAHSRKARRCSPSACRPSIPAGASRKRAPIYGCWLCCKHRLRATRSTQLWPPRPSPCSCHTRAGPRPP